LFPQKFAVYLHLLWREIKWKLDFKQASKQQHLTCLLLLAAEVVVWEIMMIQFQSQKKDQRNNSRGKLSNLWLVAKLNCLLKLLLHSGAIIAVLSTVLQAKAEMASQRGNWIKNNNKW